MNLVSPSYSLLLSNQNKCICAFYECFFWACGDHFHAAIVYILQVYTVLILVLKKLFIYYFSSLASTDWTCLRTRVTSSWRRNWCLPSRRQKGSDRSETDVWKHHWRLNQGAFCSKGLCVLCVHACTCVVLRRVGAEWCSKMWELVSCTCTHCALNRPPGACAVRD